MIAEQNGRIRLSRIGIILRVRTIVVKHSIVHCDARAFGGTESGCCRMGLVVIKPASVHIERGTVLDTTDGTSADGSHIVVEYTSVQTADGHLSRIAGGIAGAQVDTGGTDRLMPKVFYIGYWRSIGQVVAEYTVRGIQRNGTDTI